MYPAESFPYQVGEVLCFILAPILLISGIAVYVMAPHERKEKRTPIRVAMPPRKTPKVYSATRLLVSRIIGAAFIIFLLTYPFMGGVEGWKMLLAMFVIFPFPLMTVPCLAMALYLALHKTPRGIDIPAIIACVMLLLALPFGVVIVFFLPFILFSTPFGLMFLIAIAIAILVTAVRRKQKR
jgi:hypothetical protein